MLSDVTVTRIFRPCERRWAGIYDFALIVVGSLLIGLCAHIKIFLPVSIVPITGQTFAVLMIGALFGARRGSLCVLAYIAEGTAGLGVFASGVGFSVLLGPSGGYIVGFVAAAYVVGLLAEMGWDRRVGTTILAMVLGNIIIYAFGAGWLCCLTGFNKAVLATGIYPFIVGDALKIVLAAAVLPAGWKLLKKTSKNNSN